MSKKKKGKKKSSGKKKKKSVTLAAAESSLYAKCDHPLWVEIGPHKVLMMGWRHYYPAQHFDLLSSVDVFLGLSSSWEDDADFVNPYRNLYLEKLRKLFFTGGDKLSNLLVCEIPDQGVDERVFKLAVYLLDHGKKIGFGCQAGHGRTGWLAAKLIQHYEKVDGDTAVDRVRERFCVECVESTKQFTSLGCVKHKIKPVTYTTPATSYPSYWGGGGSIYHGGSIYGGYTPDVPALPSVQSAEVKPKDDETVVVPSAPKSVKLWPDDDDFFCHSGD